MLCSGVFDRGDLPGDFPEVLRPLVLFGEASLPLGRGGVALGGDNAAVGFNIDLT